MDTETKQEFQKVHESIDKLATSVAAGFAAVDERFERVETLLADVAKRLGLLEPV